MKTKRLIAVILAFLMIPIYSFPAHAAEETVFFPTDDSYVMSGSRWQHKNNGDADTMLFGTAYNRVALMKFDFSDIDLSDYDGALLDITVTTSTANSYIEVYSVSGDWNEKKVTYANFPGKIEDFVIGTTVEQSGKQRISLTLNNALKKAKDSGLNVISIALKSDTRCLSMFSSEASDISVRPTITLTKAQAYIRGQLDFEFPEVSLAEIKTEMTKTVVDGHPYLFITDENLQKIKDYAFGRDELLTSQYAATKKKADSIVKADIIKITVDTSKSTYIGKAIDFWNNIMILGLVYLVEGDEKYAQKAYEQTQYFCELDTWGTYQMIDNVQVAFGVGLCYDWFYDWLSSEQKETLVKALKSLHLDVALDLFRNPTDAKYKWAFHQAFFRSDNHALMDCSLSFLSSMAIADADFEYSTELMQRALFNLNTPFRSWYPDSCWYEGITYWKFAGPYTTRILLAMKNAFGHCFGYDEIECLLNVADQPIYSESPQGPVVLDNSYMDANTQSEPILFVTGALKGDIALQAYAIKKANMYNTADALFPLVYDPNIDYDAEISLDLDQHFRNDELLTMRNSHDASQPVFFAACVNGWPKETGMMDVGTVTLHAFGERWITNAGRENYYSGYWKTANNERWSYYRTRAESQSCVVIDPSEYGGQDLLAYSKFDVVESNKNNVYGISDITANYASQVKSYRRGVQLAKNRSLVIVQDEIKLKEPSEVYSFFNIYRADIEISEDGKSAILSKNNKKMLVTVDCDQEYTLKSMFAEPLPTSPIPPNPNSPNNEFLKLAIHFDKVEDVNIRVCFIPYLCEEELPFVTQQKFVPMLEWKLEETINVVPRLDGIKVYGEPVANFNYEDRCYDVENEIAVSDVEAVYDTTKYDVTMHKEEDTGAVDIVVVDKNDKTNINVYSVAVPKRRVPSYVDVSDMKQLKITNTEAPQPQVDNNIANMYDNDLNTRWSASGAGVTMKLTLDKEREVGCIAFNHYEGANDRIQYFDVAVSIDGVKWTDIGRFESSGVTEGIEYYDLKNTKAKYIKVIYNKTNKGNWNSIVELKVYGN